MAERYGVKPRFPSKKWWSYFWLYYKVHVLIAAFVLLIALGFVYEAVTREKFDTGVIYHSENYFSVDVISDVSDILSEYAEDIDENGEAKVKFDNLSLSPDGPEANEYNEAINTRLTASFNDDLYSVYLFSKDLCTDYLELDKKQGMIMFLPLEKWYTGSSDDVLSIDGRAYAVSASESEALKRCNINTDDLYIIVCTKEDNSVPDGKVLRFADAVSH